MMETIKNVIYEKILTSDGILGKKIIFKTEVSADPTKKL